MLSMGSKSIILQRLNQSIEMPQPSKKMPILFHSSKRCFYLLTAVIMLLSMPSYSVPLYTNCPQSITRTCPYASNTTEYLQTIKKGGQNLLSTAPYIPDYFECEQYTYDCGYIQQENETVSIANGIQLTGMTEANVDNYCNNDLVLSASIKPYINLLPSDAQCGLKVFPLTLSAADTDTFFTGYMNSLETEIITLYDAQRAASTATWVDTNINIRTAILQSLKQHKEYFNSSLNFWKGLVTNDYQSMSNFLKDEYKTQNELQLLHASYLIDSVTTRCNKYQSVNFLVDQSGSIGSVGFQLAKDFLAQYITDTLDPVELTEIHFFSGAFQQYINPNTPRATIISRVNSKFYTQGGTKTGDGMNKTIDLIVSRAMPNGVPKIMVVMTDGGSSDDVIIPANRARAAGITVLCVGIGANINYGQLLDIAGTASNIITVSSYAQLPQLVKFISNYFCKQIITIQLNTTISGNVARDPQSPNYYRVVKSQIGQYYELTIKYKNDPLQQSTFQSQVDPFPDEFTEYIGAEVYKVSNKFKVYFIHPVEMTLFKTKMTNTVSKNAVASYFAFRGLTSQYQLALNVCTRIDCWPERQYYKNLTDPVVPTPSPSPNNPTTTNTTDQAQPIPKADPSPLVYGAIVGALALGSCAGILAVMGLRKVMSGEEELQQLVDSLPNQVTQPNLMQQQQPQLPQLQEAPERPIQEPGEQFEGEEIDMRSRPSIKRKSSKGSEKRGRERSNDSNKSNGSNKSDGSKKGSKKGSKGKK